MDLQVLSENTVNKMIGANDLGENTAVICFYSKALGKPKELMKSGARVLLVPYDDEDFDDLVCDDDYEFYLPKPKKVAEFIRTAVSDGCEIICEDYCSSSAAYGCAAAILEYYEGRGLHIHPEAAQLLAESAGTDLGKIAVETDKLLKNLPEGVKEVSVADIEKNVGVSRQFSVFELTKCLSYRQAAQALKIAARMGEAPRFALPMVVAPLFTHFSRILKYHALLPSRPSQGDVARVLGVNPYFVKEYDTAVRHYSLPQCMRVISLLADYDYKGKGGDAGEATPSDLFTELVVKILNI